MRYFTLILLLGSLFCIKKSSAQCALNANAVVTDVRCHSGSDGSISINVIDGVLPVSYVWSNGATTATIANLSIGTYNVTVTDSLGCKAELSNTVKQPNAFVYNVIIHNVSCFGGSDGSLDFTLNGGTPPYTYEWRNVATNTFVGTKQDNKGLIAGIYGLVIYDAKGCKGGIFYIVAQAAEINIAGDITDVNCPGGSDGRIILTVTGGTGTKSYSWSTGERSKNISNKPAGNYSLTVTDVNGCTATNSFSIAEPDSLDASASITEPSCFGEEDGALDITAADGTAPYTFQWSTGENTEDISNLAAGQYCVTITDSKNCVSQPICFTVNDPLEIVISADITNISCPGSDDGAIDITVSGGSSPYTYSWTGGETTEDLSGLAPGIYTVIVTDANGCTLNGTFAVRTENIIIISVGITQPLCGETNGSATVTISGGEVPFSIQWSNGQSGETADNLGAGSYGVTVTDANGCSASSTIDISNTSSLSISGEVTNTICPGSNSGSIDVTVTGGILPYTFLWNTGANSEDISGLAEGVYTITVTDRSGCVAVMTFNVAEESGLSIVVSTTSPRCNQSDGAIVVTVTGGTEPITYSWSSGQNTSTVTGLESGVYVVTVSDSNGCEETQIIVLQDEQGPQISINKTDITCDNPAGTLEVVINSGTGPFTILWTTGDTTATITDLQPGIYAVEVTDSAGCSAVDFAILLPALGIVIEAAMTEPTCNGSTDASINVTVLQGTAPFTFQWSTGENSSDISGLGAGTYDVTITDAGGCSATTSVVLEEPEEIIATADSLDDLECNGDSMGSIYISVTGGTAPYNYDWSNGDSAKDLTGVTAGEYCVVITDANGCVSDTFCFTLNEPPPPQIQPDITQPTCNGGADGSISVTVTGGTPPFTYEWSTGDTLPDISGLAAGSYSLTTTDQNGCTAEGNFTINEPDSVIITILDSANVICSGDSSGLIYISVTGGTTPYSYVWSNGDTTQNISGLGAGDYQLTVSDANGCVDASDIVTLVENDSITIEATIQDVVCPGDSNGSIIIVVSGGTAPYTYLWSNGASDTILTGLGGGPHTITVTDSVGCKTSETFNVIDPPIDDVRIDTVQTVDCYGDTFGILCAIVDGVPPPFTFIWSTGDTTRCISSLGSGRYSVTVADDNGCLSFFNNFILTEPDSITISISVTGTTCFEDADGTATASVSGGTPPYSFQWSNGDIGNIADGLPAGSVSVTVVDSNGCSAISNATITQPAPLDLSNTEVNPTTCDTTLDGSITVVVTGGTAPYSFTWNDGPSGSIREDLSEGSYTVEVLDAKGCSASASFTIDGPPCNLPPVAVDDTSSLFVCMGQSIDIAVLDNDYDPDGDDIYVSSILGAPFYGTVHVNSDQTITYVPSFGYIGIDTFTYVICEIGTQPSLCDSADVIIAILPCRPNVEIPTGVSPNGDGVNDFFDIPGIEFFPNNVLLIFNRWGNKVIEYHGYNNEWNGTNESDEPLPDGTYYFVLELHDDANTTYTGYIVIHR